MFDDEAVDPTSDDGTLEDGMTVIFSTEFAVYSDEKLYMWCPGFVEAVRAAKSLPHGRIIMKQSVTYEYPKMEVPLPPVRPSSPPK